MSDVIMCPHCGQVIEIADPRLRHLSQSTFAVWHRVQRRFMRGDRLGSSEVAQIVHMTQPAAWYHLQQLRRAGLIEAVPKRKGGRYNVYRARDL